MIVEEARARLDIPESFRQPFADGARGEVITLLQFAGAMTNQELADAREVSKQATSQMLQAMVEAGQVELLRDAEGQHYQLPAAGFPSAMEILAGTVGDVPSALEAEVEERAKTLLADVGADDDASLAPLRHLCHDVGLGQVFVSHALRTLSRADVEPFWRSDAGKALCQELWLQIVKVQGEVRRGLELLGLTDKPGIGRKGAEWPVRLYLPELDVMPVAAAIERDLEKAEEPEKPDDWQPRRLNEEELRELWEQAEEIEPVQEEPLFVSPFDLEGIE